MSAHLHTATRTVVSHPALVRVRRAHREIGEALDINAENLRRAITALRIAMADYRAGYTTWNVANERHYLDQIRHARTLHSRAIRKALAVAKEMQG